MSRILLKCFDKFAGLKFVRFIQKKLEAISEIRIGLSVDSKL